MIGLGLGVVRGRADLEWGLLLWAGVVSVIELFPMPARPQLQLSLSFPVLIAVAVLYPEPLVAAVVAFLGALDSREIRREVPVRIALYNRAVFALNFAVCSWVFHSLATLSDPPWVLVPVTSLAILAGYGVNVIFVVLYMRVVKGVPPKESLKGLQFDGAGKFLLNYLGLGLVGLIISRLYLAVGFWAVLAFVLPLVFARQMFFRTLALEDAHKELKDREQVMRALSNRMAEERQDERMQIAGYLHDDLAQGLTRLSLQLDMAKKRLERGEFAEAKRNLEGIGEAKQETSDMVRALIKDLHRSPIGRRGLAEALESFAMDMSRAGPTKVEADVVEVTLPPPIQLLIYQIAREAATNAIKHAEANTIRIDLAESDDGVVLTIGDDGKGFDTSAPPPEGHFGSVMMRERATVAGGTFAITSTLGEGTTITATFPRVWVEEGSQLEESDDGSLRPTGPKLSIPLPTPAQLPGSLASPATNGGSPAQSTGAPSAASSGVPPASTNGTPPTTSNGALQSTSEAPPISSNGAPPQASQETTPSDDAMETA
jgi:signal transduction histidine kinase